MTSAAPTVTFVPSRLAANSVGLSEMQDNAIGSAEIINESILSEDIKDNEVETADEVAARAWIRLIRVVGDRLGRVWRVGVRMVPVVPSDRQECLSYLAHFQKRIGKAIDHVEQRGKPPVVVKPAFLLCHHSRQWRCPIHAVR